MSHDERFFSDPKTFDALRFYRLRQDARLTTLPSLSLVKDASGSAAEDGSAPNTISDGSSGHKWQFTSIGDTNVNFGAGKHACPGRFFAGNEIKMILAYFLIHYDIRFKDGQERPQPMTMVMSKSPDPNAEVLFRKRDVAA